MTKSPSIVCTTIVPFAIVLNAIVHEPIVSYHTIVKY